MLCKYLYGKVLFKYFDVGILSYPFYKRFFYGFACPVLMMKNPVLRVPAFPVKIIGTILFFVKRNAKFNEVLDPVRSFAHHHSYDLFIAAAGPCNQGVMDMFFKIIRFTEYSSNTSLGISCICIFKICLCNNAHFPEF